MLCVVFYSFYSLWCLLDGGRGDLFVYWESVCLKCLCLLLVNSFREREIVCVLCVCHF